MGGPSRILPTGLVLLMLISIITPLAVNETSETLDDEIEYLGTAKSSTLVDVPSLQIGDEWVYDAFFDVEGLVQASLPSANVQTLTGTMTTTVDSITLETVENRSTLVYTLESIGTFGAQGVTLPSGTFLGDVTADLTVAYVGVEEFRVSDMALISRSMTLDVDFGPVIIVGTMDIADITILTTYAPPQEGYDFPLTVGEGHFTNYTSTVQWSGSSDYFDIPEDETRQTSGYSTVVAVGNPGVTYSGCSNSYNVTQYNSNGDIAGFNWYCPAVSFNAWQHIEDAIGLVIDFKLKSYTPASRTRLVSVNLQFPAYFPDIEIGAWINITDAGGTPVAGETVQFRYEVDSDIRTLTTASNGSAYALFDTGHSPDPSWTDFDLASHGVIGWIQGSNQVGVSTITIDDNLVEVDLVTSAASVAMERVRGDETIIQSSATGLNAVPGDQLTFSVPVRNIGLLSSPPTELEVTTPDGTTSRANVPALGPLAEARAEVSWTVPNNQPIGDVSLNFEADPDELVTEDANRSNNVDSLSLFIGRLPTATMANVIPALTFEDVVIDGTNSVDLDGGELACTFVVAIENNQNAESPRDPITETNTECQYTANWEDDGVYDVSLTVVDDEGDVHSTSQSITILNRPAIINLASSVQTLKVGESVTFNAYDHSDIDTNTPEAPVNMLWQPPNDPSGEPYTCSEGLVTQECTVVPQNEGQFMMSFRGMDDDAAVTSASLSVTVTNIAPSDAAMDLRRASDGVSLIKNSQDIWEIDEDQELELVGSVFDSPNDMDTLRWSWQPDVEKNPSLQMTSEGPESIIPVHWSDSSGGGLHVIKMQVFDNDNASSGIVNGWVRVSNVAPTIEPFEPQFPLPEDFSVSLTGVYSDTPSDVESLVACWDTNPFVDNDGQGTAEDDCDQTGAVLEKSWPSAGTYTVIFHVTDDDGDRASQTVNFTVENRKPVAAIYVSTLTPDAGEKFSLSANQSTDTPSDMDSLVYYWDLDTSDDADSDGFADNDFDEQGMEIWIDIDDAGTHEIRLIVFDDNGEEGYASVFIEVQSVESGFLGGILNFENNGVAIIVIILLLVLGGLLGILALTSMRSKRADPWDTIAAGVPTDSIPSSAPQSNMFAAPASAVPEGTPPVVDAAAVQPTAPVETAASTTPPIPATGLPEGWTEEQWSYYGAQWLEQQAAESVEAPPQPVVETPQPVAETPAPTWPTSEGDMDLDL
ncbi:MAG: CARDB domain-containing protein [Candidatus Thermoplasmatota archaeon]|nr:CARDB domain-containing protein [Candidatus Thermoplasmatota archaeon]